MGIKRFELNDEQWEGRAAAAGQGERPWPDRSDNRLFVNGCLRSCGLEFIGATCLSAMLVGRRCTAASVAGVWERVFDALTTDRDNQHRMIDSTNVRAHQQASSGKKGGQDQALGRSRGGLTTKIHMLVDGQGRPLRLRITAGQAHDLTAAPALLKGLKADAVLADKAYDSNDYARRS